MTNAPPNLIAVRRLLLDHLDIHENSRAYPTDLDPDEVGIVGDPAHRGGYHCGSNRTVSGDYSVTESSRDRTGLTLNASALDVGQFSITVNGRTHNLKTFSVWLVAQCSANTADTRDIREVIYSPDGKTVKRWDRLKRRASGDNSHMYHTHVSYFRDATKSGRDLTAVYRRYLSEIGLTTGDDDLTPAQAKQLSDIHYLLWQGAQKPDGSGRTDLREDLYKIQRGQAELRTALAPDAIVRGVLAGLTPEAIAAAIPSALVSRVADELASRMTTPRK